VVSGRKNGRTEKRGELMAKVKGKMQKAKGLPRRTLRRHRGHREKQKLEQEEEHEQEAYRRDAEIAEKGKS
jgi:hypothetical protein